MNRLTVRQNLHAVFTRFWKGHPVKGKNYVVRGNATMNGNRWILNESKVVTSTRGSEASPEFNSPILWINGDGKDYEHLGMDSGRSPNPNSVKQSDH